MVQVWFPGLTFNGLSLTRGQLLDVSLLGVGLVLPPWDMSILPVITFWGTFLIFDTDWITTPLTAAVTAVPKLVWDYLTGTLQAQTDAYYEAHPERKPV